LADVAPPKASHLPSGVQDRLLSGLTLAGIGGGKITAMDHVTVTSRSAEE
jgi:hypothetical protein